MFFFHENGKNVNVEMALVHLTCCKTRRATKVAVRKSEQQGRSKQQNFIILVAKHEVFKNFHKVTKRSKKHSNALLVAKHDVQRGHSSDKPVMLRVSKWQYYRGLVAKHEFNMI